MENKLPKYVEEIWQIIEEVAIEMKEDSVKN